MGEKDSYDAMREAAEEVVDHPERTPKHEEALGRYLSGVAYQETQREARERKPRAENAGSDEMS